MGFPVTAIRGGDSADCRTVVRTLGAETRELCDGAHAYTFTPGTCARLSVMQYVVIVTGLVLLMMVPLRLFGRWLQRKGRAVERGGKDASR